MKKILTLIALSLSLGTWAQVKVISIEACLDSAAKYNRTLQNAAIDIQMAGEQKKEAFTKFFPQLSANVMAFHAFDEIIQADGRYPKELAALGQINPAFAALAGQPFSVREANGAYAVTGTLVQPIFMGGQIIRGNQLASIGKQVAELQMQIQTKDVMQKVTENYYTIAKLKLNMATLASARTQLEAIYQEVNSYVTAGVTTRNDLLKVRLKMQELSSDSLRVANAHHVMCLLLAQQIGMAGENIDVEVNLQDGNENPMDLYIQPQTAVQGRQELALAEKNVEAGKLKICMERSKHLPKVAIGLMGYHAGIDGLSNGVEALTGNSFNNGMVFGTVNVPITSWWGGSHAIRRQKLSQKQSQNQLAEAREKLTIDIESAWSSLVEAYKQIEIAQTSVDEAEENLRMSMDKYRMGTEILSDLLESETLLRKSENLLTQARADYMTKRADYMRKTR